MFVVFIAKLGEEESGVDFWTYHLIGYPGLIVDWNGNKYVHNIETHLNLAMNFVE
jgi:hypothetical protein